MMDARLDASRRSRSRTLSGVLAAALVVVLLVILRAGAPYLFKRSTLESEVATQLRLTTGLTLDADHTRFDLLPRPHVILLGVHVHDATGAVRLESERLHGDVRLLPLIVGRLELSDATLRRPRLDIDLARNTIDPGSAIGRASRGPEAREATRLGSISFVDGTITFSRDGRQALPDLTAVDATIDWPDLDSSASLAGSLRVLGMRVDTSAWLSQPAQLMRGNHSVVDIRLHAPQLELATSGDLSNGHEASFRGHVTSSAASLTELLAQSGSRVSLPAPFNHFNLSGSLAVSGSTSGVGSLDLQDAMLQADGNHFEGTLAYTGGIAPLVSGTLASDRLDVAPFLPKQAFVDSGRAWSRAPLPPPAIGPVALDLRVSAAHLIAAPVTIDDAALSVMTRGDRLEIGLNEARAYGGAAKGRLTLGKAGEAVTLRGAGLLTGADLSGLSLDLTGSPTASGTISGSLNLDATGANAADLVGSLSGWLKLRASDGELAGSVLAPEAKPTTVGALMGLGRSTPFSTAQITVRLDGGHATADDARLAGAAGQATLDGAADLSRRTLDVHVETTEAAADGKAREAARRYDLSGSFDKLRPVLAPSSAKATRP